jgi:hypothetical protein
MDTQADATQRAASFSPPRVGDFHVPDRFARVIFHDPNAAVPAPTAVPAAAPAGEVAPRAAPLKIPAPMIDELRRQMDLRRTQGAGLGGQVRRINDVDRPAPGEPVPTAPTAMTTMTE